MANHNGVYYSSSSGLNLRTAATTRINISTGGVIQFNSEYTFPTTDGSANTVLITDGNGALSFGTVPNAGLTNSSITINGTAVSLGGSINVGDITGVSAGTGLTGGGTTGSVTVSLDYAGVDNFIDSATNLEGTGIALTDTIVYHDATDNNVKKGLVSDLPFTSNVGDITAVTAGNGLTGGGTSGAVTLNVGASTGITVTADAVALDYFGTDNFMYSAPNFQGTAIDYDDVIIYHDGATNNVRRALVNDLPFSNNSGTVTSVAITGTDGIDVDSGSPITTSGTITLGLSNVPNTSLANSSITINGTAVSLGGSINVGDITGVSAGTGLTGGGTSGAVTVSIDYAGVDNFIDSATNLEGTAISTADTIIYHDATDNNVKKGLVSDLPFTSNVGDITAVTAGNGLTGGGTSGAVTLDVGAAIGGGIVVGANDISLDTTSSRNIDHDSVSILAGTGLSGGGTISVNRTLSLDYAGTDNFIDSATNLEGTDIATNDTIVYHDATDNNVKKGLVSDLPFTNNLGTVTSVGITAGSLIDVTGGPITSSGNITVNVDLSELTTSTNNNDADFFAVIDSSNVQRKIGKGTVTLSGFNDDVSFYRNNGTLNTARLVTQAGNQLTFNSTAAETTSFSNTIATPVRTPRVHMEAGALYSAVLELNSSEPPVNLIEGNDVGQSNVFMVDGLGNLTATSKAFDIPHPNPEKKEQGMRLKHGNLEGPEHGVYVRGRQIDDKEIELPEYWRDLVDPDSITVQLTSVGSHQNLYVKEIKDNVVYIGNGNLFSNKIDCYYFIQAERKDIDKIKVEYQK